MVRSLARLSLGIAIGTVLFLSLPSWPMCGGRAQAAGLTAKDNARAKQARQLFKEGQYEDAAKIFSSLSIDYPDKLAFTRNLGACYYYLRRPDPALSNLREYLRRSQDTTADDRAEVEGWMAEMEKLRDQPAATGGAAHAETAPPTTAPVSSPIPATAGAIAAPLPASGEPPVSGAVPSAQSAPALPQTPTTLTPVQAVATETQPPPRSYSNLAWIAGGVGVACLVAGGIFTGLAASKFSSTESQYDANVESAGKTYQALQWVGYGLGAAGIATAVVLFTRNNQTSGTVALSPIVGQGFAGASIGGSY
jgi:tetratricopeptide (TPR) repeat protein